MGGELAHELPQTNSMFTGIAGFAALQDVHWTLDRIPGGCSLAKSSLPGAVLHY